MTILTLHVAHRRLPSSLRFRSRWSAAILQRDIPGQPAYADSRQRSMGVRPRRAPLGPSRLCWACSELGNLQSGCRRPVHRVCHTHHVPFPRRQGVEARTVHPRPLRTSTSLDCMWPVTLTEPTGTSSRNRRCGLDDLLGRDHRVPRGADP